MLIGIVLLLLSIFMFVFVMPRWAHSRNWGYVPSTSVGVVVFGVLALAVMEMV